MPVGSQEFRAALGHFASGVNVVTARMADGQLAGITVTAFSSLSLEPPLVLVCIDKCARLHDALAGGQPFAVNVLSQDQEVLSRRFATSTPDQFAGVGYTTSSAGTAWLDDMLAVIECRFVEAYAGGPHDRRGRGGRDAHSRRQAAGLFPGRIRTISVSVGETNALGRRKGSPFRLQDLAGLHSPRAESVQARGGRPPLIELGSRGTLNLSSGGSLRRRVFCPGLPGNRVVPCAARPFGTRGADPAPAEDAPASVDCITWARYRPTMTYHGAAWLTRKERDGEEDTKLLLEALHLKAGQKVCDLGCGNGFYTLRMAKRVGEKGTVSRSRHSARNAAPARAAGQRRGLKNIKPGSAIGSIRGCRRASWIWCCWSTFITSCRTPRKYCTRSGRASSPRGGWCSQSFAWNIRRCRSSCCTR